MRVYSSVTSASRPEQPRAGGAAPRCRDLHPSGLLPPPSPGCGPCLQSPAGRMGKEGQGGQEALPSKGITSTHIPMAQN